MSFTITESKSYNHPLNDVLKAAITAVNGLEGKVKSQDETNKRLNVLFDKKILGKVLGDRTQMEIKLESVSPQETSMQVEIFPLDAIGQKLLFGARKGVSRTVLTWFYAHLDHHLKG